MPGLLLGAELCCRHGSGPTPQQANDLAGQLMMLLNLPQDSVPQALDLVKQGYLECLKKASDAVEQLIQLSADVPVRMHEYVAVMAWAQDRSLASARFPLE